jgi:hypothetical protein
MAHDPTIPELLERAAELKQTADELFAEHERLHVKLVETFEKIKRLHYLPPVLGPPPPDQPPPPRFNEPPAK